MTDLVLADESKQFQDLARDFSQNEIAPRAEAFDHKGESADEILKKIWELGLVNVLFPEKLGGLGLSLTDATVIAEELGAGCMGITAALWANDLAVAPLLVAGSDQHKSLLEALVNDTSFAGYCLPEHANVSARKDGSNFVLVGEAIAINAHSAAWFLVKAHNSLFVVNASNPGIVIGEPFTRIGLKAADIRTIQFKDAKVQATDLVGKAEEAEATLQTARITSDPVIAAYAIGMARAGMEHSIKYSKQRHTFGQPIGNHQAVAFMIADMAKNIEAARMMTRKAAWLVDHNEGCARQSTSAKQFALDAAMTAATDAVQVFGGYGYSREYPVEKLMRDAKTLAALEASALTNRLAVGKELVAAK